MYFNVQKKLTHNNVSTVLPYDVEILNVGNGFNTSSGIFTAPCAGTYYFSFTSSVDNTSDDFLWLSLQLNNVQVANCSPNGMHSCNIPYTVKLKVGDRVHVSLIQGSTSNAIFIGWLVAENIFDS